ILFWIFQLARQFSGGFALKDHSHVRSRQTPLGMVRRHAFAGRISSSERPLSEWLRSRSDDQGPRLTRAALDAIPGFAVSVCWKPAHQLPRNARTRRSDGPLLQASY